jgi:DNA-binding transcriptional LysR family regulator
MRAERRRTRACGTTGRRHVSGTDWLAARRIAPPEFFDILPISWVTEFLAHYTGISLELVVDNAYLDLLVSGVDLAFRPESLLDESATRRVLQRSRRRLVASPKYLEACGTPADLDELSQHECLVVSRNSGPDTWCLNGPEGRVEVRVRSRFLASSYTPVRQAAVDGLGIAFLYDVYAKRDIEGGSLVPVLDQYRSDPSNYCAVFPDHRHIRRVATIFAEAVQKQLIETYQE